MSRTKLPLLHYNSAKSQKKENKITKECKNIEQLLKASRRSPTHKFIIKKENKDYVFIYTNEKIIADRYITSAQSLLGPCHQTKWTSFEQNGNKTW